MTEIDAVAGGESILVTDDWKWNICLKKMAIDIFCVGIIGAVGYPISTGLYSSQAVLSGLMYGAAGGLINSLYYAYQLNNKYESGKVYEVNF